LWRYSGLAGFDVLSRIVEIAWDQPFDRFSKSRQFDPLSVKCAGFNWTPDRASPVVTLDQRTRMGYSAWSPCAGRPN
jgi:hypothetical protein